MTGDPRIVEPPRADPAGSPAFDPLRLCVFATVALLGWLLGPVALLIFAVVGFLGYHRARRAGLLRSRCVLRDTRVVLIYLAALAAVALSAVVLAVSGNFRLGWW